MVIMDKKLQIKIIRIFCGLCCLVLIPLNLLFGVIDGNINWFYSLVIIPLALIVAAGIGESYIKLIEKISDKCHKGTDNCHKGTDKIPTPNNPHDVEGK